jgi:hypothetical protein
MGAFKKNTKSSPKEPKKKWIEETNLTVYTDNNQLTVTFYNTTALKFKQRMIEANLKDGWIEWGGGALKVSSIIYYRRS